jgi:hypothetical protein
VERVLAVRSALYVLYETQNTFTIDELITFSTQSSVTSAADGMESLPLVRHKTMYLTLEGYFRESFLGGDLPRVMQFDSYSTLGAVAYWYVPKNLRFIRRFFLEVSTTRANGLNGYNTGIGFSPNYNEIYKTVRTAVLPKT